MPVAMARVKPLSPFASHDGRRLYHAALGGGCRRLTPDLAERRVRQFSNFSGSPPAFF
jgi:hypothetical protein